MSDDQFFDGGWCWMAHPDWNNGNAIPVFMCAADGARFYIPLDPSNATDFEWDERAAEWQMVQPPMADLERAVELDDLRASHQRLKEALARLFLAADETGAVFAATEDELCAAANDPDAEAIVREQAAAVLQCREALRSAP